MPTDRVIALLDTCPHCDASVEAEIAVEEVDVVKFGFRHYPCPECDENLFEAPRFDDLEVHVDIWADKRDDQEEEKEYRGP